MNTQGNSSETLHIRMVIGETAYTLDEVVDTSDVLTAYRVGRGISEAIVGHVTRSAGTVHDG